MKKKQSAAKPIAKATKAKGLMQKILANQDRFCTSKHSPGNLHEFNLAHYDLEIDGGWVRLRMKPATLKKSKP